MARKLRISHPARADIQAILRESRTTWGSDAADRYRALIGAALDRVAQDPLGGAARPRPDLGADLLVLHPRHIRPAPVRAPAHLLIYRPAPDDAVEALRLLHDRMDPGRHLPD